MKTCLAENLHFQTPEHICKYMGSLVPFNAGRILEPTSGAGNLARVLKQKGLVITPKDFFKLATERFDWIVMNPPFTPMSSGYTILFKCMEMSDNIIALMPWLTLINSQKRTCLITEFGLCSITHLPRNTFPGSRVQTCILEMHKGYKLPTIFRAL